MIQKRPKSFELLKAHTVYMYIVQLSVISSSVRACMNVPLISVSKFLSTFPMLLRVQISHEECSKHSINNVIPLLLRLEWSKHKVLITLWYALCPRRNSLISSSASNFQIVEFTCPAFHQFSCWEFPWPIHCIAGQVHAGLPTRQTVHCRDLCTKICGCLITVRSGALGLRFNCVVRSWVASTARSFHCLGRELRLHPPLVAQFMFCILRNVLLSSHN